MRKIKFRGMTVSGKFVYGNLNILKKMSNFIPPGVYISNTYGSPFAYIIRPETVEQYTGLKDKNGKDIYEGDRIKEGVVIFHTEYLGFFVRFEGNIYDDEYKPLHDIPLIEIIGNIHEGENNDTLCRD